MCSVTLSKSICGRNTEILVSDSGGVQTTIFIDDLLPTSEARKFNFCFVGRPSAALFLNLSFKVACPGPSCAAFDVSKSYSGPLDISGGNKRRAAAWARGHLKPYCALCGVCVLLFSRRDTVRSQRIVPEVAGHRFNNAQK